MSSYDVEVVWPLHRSHYLSRALADAGVDWTQHQSPRGTTAVVRRCGHTRALGGGCLQQRIAELLHTSRRSVGRMVEADVTAALRDVDVPEQARTCLAETASRGSTSDEREAAERGWSMRCAMTSTSSGFTADTPRRPTAEARAARAVKRNGAGSSVKRPAATPATHGATLPDPPACDVRARSARRAHTPTTAHSPSQHAHRLRDCGRDTAAGPLHWARRSLSSSRTSPGPPAHRDDPAAGRRP